MCNVLPEILLNNGRMMFWDTLKRQIPSAIANNLETGPSENQLLHCSFVCEPLSFGRLFIAVMLVISFHRQAPGIESCIFDIYYFQGLPFFKDKNSNC